MRSASRETASRETSQARAQRAASRTAFSGLSGPEAHSLARSTFGADLRGVTQGIALKPGGRVREYLSDYLASVENANGTSSIVASSLPMRDESGRPVDLRLESSTGGYSGRASLVDASLPSSAADPARLSDSGVAFAPVGASNSAPSLLDNHLFYANAFPGQAVDYALLPTLTGLESFWVLRSEQQSPEQLRLRFTLPAGAQLRMASALFDQLPDGTVLVTQQGASRPLVAIQPVTAYDADHVEVPVTTRVDGDELVIGVAHRGKDLRYPILVDPLAEELWIAGTTSFQYCGDWSESHGWQVDNWLNGSGTGFSTTCDMNSYGYGYGLFSGAYAGGSYANDARSEWYWQAPTDVYISDINANALRHAASGSGLFTGIRAGGGPGGPWVTYREDGDSFTNRTHTHWAAGNTTGTRAYFGLHMIGTGVRNPAALAGMGGAWIYLADQYVPDDIRITNAVPALQLPAGGTTRETPWIDTGSTSVQLSAHVSDRGLGAKTVGLVKKDTAVPASQNQPWLWKLTDDWCLGKTYVQYCNKSWDTPAPPHDFSQAAPYDTSHPNAQLRLLPEGVTATRLRALDYYGNAAYGTETINVKVDRSAPTLALAGGTLYAARHQTDDDGGLAGGLFDEAAAVTVTASDAYSGVRRIELWINGVQVQARDASCSGVNCPTSFAATFGVTQAQLNPDADNTITLVARDALAANSDQPGSTRHTATLSSFTVWAAGTTSKTDPTDSTPDDPNDGPTAIQDASLTNPCGSDPEFTDALSCTMDASSPLIASVGLEDNLDSVLDSLLLYGDDDSAAAATRAARAGSGACPMNTPITVPPTTVETWRRYGFSDGSGTARNPRIPDGPNAFWQTFNPGGKAEQLNVRRVRLIVPYELVTRAENQHSSTATPDKHYQAADKWTKDAVVREPGDTRPRREPLISFEHAFREHGSEAGSAPSPTAYRTAVEAFRSQFPAVKLYTAWNEPNNKTQPTHGSLTGAPRAGRYWRHLNEICQRGQRCVAIAGDFLDDKTFTASYRRGYLDGMTGGAGRPREKITWAYHPYGLIRYGSTTASATLTQARKRYDAFANDMVGQGQVWLTEGGASMSKLGSPVRSQAAQAGDLSRFFADDVLTQPRVKRFYYYNWFGQSGSDSGLVGLAGSTDLNAPVLDLATHTIPADPVGQPLRQVYCVLRNRTNPSASATPCP